MKAWSRESSRSRARASPARRRVSSCTPLSASRCRLVAIPVAPSGSFSRIDLPRILRGREGRARVEGLSQRGKATAFVLELDGKPGFLHPDTEIFEKAGHRSPDGDEVIDEHRQMSSRGKLLDGSKDLCQDLRRDPARAIDPQPSVRASPRRCVGAGAAPKQSGRARGGPRSPEQERFRRPPEEIGAPRLPDQESPSTTSPSAASRARRAARQKHEEGRRTVMLEDGQEVPGPEMRKAIVGDLEVDGSSFEPMEQVPGAFQGDHRAGQFPKEPSGVHPGPGILIHQHEKWPGRIRLSRREEPAGPGPHQVPPHLPQDPCNPVFTLPWRGGHRKSGKVRRGIRAPGPEAGPVIRPGRAGPSGMFPRHFQ
jgi:hypothetical protein